MYGFIPVSYPVFPQFCRLQLKLLLLLPPVSALSSAASIPAWMTETGLSADKVILDHLESSVRALASVMKDVGKDSSLLVRLDL